ncbi:beta-propeller domain-containing protein [Bacillus sp. OxB-1]|uniref:beta-propeller domain-containing protein n=1 Tax=Bacillus sp. (strain OxB-1) TaxID=98228 RepID=UPI00059749C9|nr:beta-propeller domain-containing protein [Bacillus sp. OxB-1]
MRKPVIWIASGVAIAFLALAFALSIQRVTVTASGIALTEKGWQAGFSAPLNQKAERSGDLYITDQEGNRVETDIRIENEGHTVHVNGLEPGAYTLHIKKEAVKGKRYKSLQSDRIDFTVHETITSVASEKELKAYFDRAKSMMESERKALRQESATMESANDKAEAQSGSADHSTTNNQVAGVDEADIVKTDGDFIYSIMGHSRVMISDIRNPEKLRKVHELKGNDSFYPNSLFLHDDLLIVLGSKMSPDQGVSNKQAADMIMPMNEMTVAQIYDVSKPEQPKLIREVGAEGYLNGARKTGDMLYFVTNIQPFYWIMEEGQEEDLRPAVLDSTEDDTPKLLDYKDISILPGAVEPKYSIITAVDLSSPAKSGLVTKGYLGSSEQLYMSKDHLYLTASIYETGSAAGGQARSMIWNPGSANSEVFKFALDGTNVAFQNSATLKGTLLNQFSMDEHNGHFRAVTTEGNQWDEKNPSKNHLFILDENMKQVGSVEGLAKGERIYSARFMGEKAYMVTFRETDPLFVIDIADPVAPKVLGELKIPGFSNYLHPLDEHHLIGFGYETTAKKNPQGGEPIILTEGMKISLFDVSDFANPKEKDTEIIGGRGSYSPIQHDHKSLFQHPQRNLFGFPAVLYEERKQNKEFWDVDFLGAGALIYEITPEKGIVLKGDLLEGKQPGEQYVDWEKEIQRILYSGDKLYTISMKEITQYGLDSMKKENTLQLQ